MQQNSSSLSDLTIIVANGTIFLSRLQSGVWSGQDRFKDNLSERTMLTISTARNAVNKWLAGKPRLICTDGINCDLQQKSPHHPSFISCQSYDHDITISLRYKRFKEGEVTSQIRVNFGMRVEYLHQPFVLNS
jgi:hypothetical protein